MNSLLSTLRGVLVLDQPTYERFRDSKDAMKRGVAILLICFLIAGSLQFLMRLVDNVRPFDAEQADKVKQEFQQGFEQWQQFMPQGDEFTTQFLNEFMQNFEQGLNIGVKIDSIPRPLPRGIAGFFESLGAWITRTLAHLGSWLFYAIWVLLFAKLLGGNGGVDRFLGLTALYAVPNLLGIFSPIACIGPLLALVGWIWGVAVFVRGVQVSQRFTAGKAILATILPALIVILVIGFFTILGVLGIISAAGQQ